MAKLVLKFEDRSIQEVSLSFGTITIGRQPDNVLRIDNPAVSGHHAKVYSEGDHYVLEDCESFNGTFVNNRRISRLVLRDGDKALIGKHTIEFQDEDRQGLTAQRRSLDGSINGQAQALKAKLPQLDRTVYLDTAKAKELIALAVAAGSSTGAAAAAKSGGQIHVPTPAPPVMRQTVGTLTILEGRCDQRDYVLTSQITVIGRSKMAGIQLKRWFAPRIAATIYRAEDGYFIASASGKIKIKVNDVVVEGAKTQLEPGQVIEVAGIKALFGFCEA